MIRKNYLLGLLFIITLHSCYFSSSSVEQISESDLKEYDGIDTAWIDRDGNALLMLRRDDGALGIHTNFGYKKGGKLYYINPMGNLRMGWFGDSLLYFYEADRNAPAGAHWQVVKGGSIAYCYDEDRGMGLSHQVAYDQGRVVKIGYQSVNLDSMQVKQLKTKSTSLPTTN